MNCCDEYGDCRQGRDCPARRDTPINGGKAKLVEITTPGMHSSQVARIKSTRPAWLPGDCVPPEAGNFQILDLGPDDIDAGQPLAHDKSMALVRTLLSLLLAVLLMVLVGALALAVSYSTEAHADVLWAFLAGLS
jgi:hypothetical protein